MSDSQDERYRLAKTFTIQDVTIMNQSLYQIGNYYQAKKNGTATKTFNVEFLRSFLCSKWTKG